jgi:ubiquinone/menaquinone biosynthesis C-methylase UbiE
MELSVAVHLIEKGIVQSDRPQQWADLGAGSGLFTRALLTLLPPASLIHAVDQDDKALSSLRKESKSDQVKTHVLNFEHDDLPFSKLDGLLLANALHFVKDQKTFLMNVKGRLKPDGRLIVIEYDLSKANQWVPYPIRFSNLHGLIVQSGFSRVQRLGEVPSRFNASVIYSSIVEV